MVDPTSKRCVTFDLRVKFILVGDTGVGKTAFIEFKSQDRSDGKFQMVCANV